MAPIPLPAGALHAEDWELNPDLSVTRMFSGTRRGERLPVAIWGEQDRSGAVLWRIANVAGVELTPQEVREVMADLQATADEMEGFEAHDLRIA